MAILSISFSLSAKAEDCTSNALEGIIATPEDENSCTFSFTFTLNSGYTATSYLWDFGDESFSQIQNPFYKYSNYGPFDVCLTVTDQNGCTSQLCIRVDPGECDGGFCNYMTGEGCCIDICAEDVPGWTWQVELGTTAGDIIEYLPGEHIISHFCYDEPGYYTVTLNYFDSFNDVVAQYIRNIYIPESGCGEAEELCSYWLCLTDYFDQFGCAASITYSVNNVDYTYVFPSGPVSNTSYGVGVLINELSAFASTLGLQYSNSFDELEDCKKGPGDVIGHFFLNVPSNIDIVSLNAAPDNVQCLPLNCPITPNCQQTVNGIPQDFIIFKPSSERCRN